MQVAEDKRQGFMTPVSRRTGLSTKKKSPLDDRLQQQFIYFRMEFVNAASNYGVTLPLDILEDNTGRMVSFVKQSGPEFILQILVTESENIHLLRMALSLLIVTMSLLRRCLPPTAGGTADVNSSQAFSQSSSEWVRSSTAHICNSGAVSVCINLLLSTYLKDIHELIINLLSQIVCTSRAAAAQMLEPLNSHLDKDENDNKLAHDFKRSTRIVGDVTTSGKSSPRNSRHADAMKLLSKETTCLSFLISVCAVYRNRLTVMSGCADIILAIAKAHPTAEVALAIAQTPTTTTSVMAHVAGKDAHHSKSSMSLNSPRQSQGTTSEGNGVYKAPRMTGSVMSSTGGGGERFCYEHNPELHQPTGTVAIHWAGIKILLRVLMRIISFQPHALSSMPLQSHHEPEGYFPRQQSADDKTPRIVEDAPVAQRRVYTAISKLVAQSTDVATFVLGLNGAEELLIQTAKQFRQREVSEEFASVLYFCESALLHAKPLVEKKRLGHANSPTKPKIEEKELVNMPTPNYKSDPHILPQYLHTGAKEIDMSYMASTTPTTTITNSNSNRKVVKFGISGSDKKSDKVSARATKDPLSRSPSSTMHIDRQSSQSSQKLSPMKTNSKPEPMTAKSPEKRVQTAPTSSNRRTDGRSPLLSSADSEQRSINKSPDLKRVTRGESSTSSVGGADGERSVMSMESLSSSLSSAASVSWVFKNLPSTPKLPRVTTATSTPNNDNVRNNSPASISPGEHFDYGALFDSIADKELKRLLRNGYYVSGRPQSIMDRSTQDLRLGSLLPHTPSRASTSHSISRSRGYSPQHDHRIATADSSHQRMQNFEMGWDLESKSLGLYSENSEESPQVMNRVAPEYSIDIHPTSKARNHGISPLVRDNLDEKSVGTAESSSAISAITMDSLRVQNQYVSVTGGIGLPGGHAHIGGDKPSSSKVFGDNRKTDKSDGRHAGVSAPGSPKRGGPSSIKKEEHIDMERMSSLDGSDVDNRSDVDGQSNAATSVKFLNMDAFELFS